MQTSQTTMECAPCYKKKRVCLRTHAHKTTQPQQPAAQNEAPKAATSSGNRQLKAAAAAAGVFYRTLLNKD
jgi:hypothetical protein